MAPHIEYNPIAHCLRISNFLTTQERLDTDEAITLKSSQYPQRLQDILIGILEISNGVLYGSLYHESVYAPDLILALRNTKTFPAAPIVNEVLRFIRDMVQLHYKDQPLTLVTSNMVCDIRKLHLLFDIPELNASIIEEIKEVLEKRFPNAITISER